MEGTGYFFVTKTRIYNIHMNVYSIEQAEALQFSHSYNKSYTLKQSCVRSLNRNLSVKQTPTTACMQRQKQIMRSVKSG